MPKIIGLIAISSIMLCTSIMGYCKGIDCNKTLNQIEESICDDDRLSEFDEVLSTTYDLTLKISANKNTLKREQMHWLATVRNRCKNDECLADAYEERISELERQWEHQNRELNLAKAQANPAASNPFEGVWENCQLWKGEKICSRNTYLQFGNKICGESESWATDRTYIERVKATAINNRQAKIDLICGIPANNDAPEECDLNDRDPTKWTEAKESGFSVCNGQLRRFNEPCESANYFRSLIFRRLSDSERQRLLKEPWVKNCFESLGIK